jgi:hypothetical protein
MVFTDSNHFSIFWRFLLEEKKKYAGRGIEPLTIVPSWGTLARGSEPPYAPVGKGTRICQ